MAQLRLLSTDFDGTLIGLGGGQDACAPLLAAVLEEVTASGARWAINTGRSLEFTLMGLKLFQAPVEPDFLVVNERHLFERRDREWVGVEPWNRICDATHVELMQHSGELLEELRLWVSVTSGVDLLPHAVAPEGLVTRDEETMDLVVQFLDEVRQGTPNFSYQRNSVYLRFSHRSYDKGAALQHLARELEVEVEDILAAGDNHNDLSMLRPEVAGMCLCPANAISEVQQVVTANGGYVARSYYGEGTAEGVRHFMKASQ